MALKRMLAILFAVCMMVPLVACKKGKNDNTGGDTTTTTVADVTGDSGEVVGTTTGEGETTPTETNEQGEVVVPTDDKGQTVPTKSNNTPGGTTKSPGRTTTKTSVTTVSRPNIPGYVGGTVKLKTGTVRSDVGVNFGGKTFNYANGGEADEFFQKEAALFKQKYNGNIKFFNIGLTNYVQKVAAAQAGGTVYDIVFLYTDTFPSVITANLTQPVTNYITTADLWDTKHPEKGGFSNSMMQQFSWNSQAYCLAGNYLQSPYMIFYNKVIFRDAGLEDPLTLYKQGKWTWEKFLEMGRDYTDAAASKYFMQSIPAYTTQGFFASYNTDIATMKNGVIQENLSDKRLYNAFKMLQDMHYGAGRIADIKSGGNTRVERFVSGNTATCFGTAGNWGTFYNLVPGKAVFEGKTSNIGMVPAPVQNTEGVHGLYGNMGFCVGAASSDPRVAVCWSMLDSTYNVREAYVESTPAEYKKVICEVLDSDKLKSPAGTFESSIGKLPGLAMVNKVCSGEDITSVFASYKKQIQRVLDAACK